MQSRRCAWPMAWPGDGKRLFFRGNKGGAGTSPAPFRKLSLLFGGLTTSSARLLRRRFFRRGGLALRGLLLLRYCHDVPPIGLAVGKFTLATSARPTARIAFETRAVTDEGKVSAFSTRFSFITLNARFGHKI